MRRSSYTRSDRSDALEDIDPPDPAGVLVRDPHRVLERSLKKSSLALGLFPVSSYTREGFVPLIGEFARIFGGGEEYEE